MAFLVSPGVNVTEKDLTNVIPAVSTSIGAISILLLSTRFRKSSKPPGWFPLWSNTKIENCPSSATKILPSCAIEISTGFTIPWLLFQVGCINK